MADRRQLPHLLRLLDDDSPLVQEAVYRELTAFGPRLEEEFQKLDLTLNDVQRERLRTFQHEFKRTRLEESWPSWFSLEDEAEQLEAALGLLCDFQESQPRPGRLTERLDALAEEFRLCEAPTDAFELAHFLFQRKRLRGGRADYYNPAKSNLIQVLRKRRGNPISLTCIYMLVGHRLGISIEGCNFPGHFMARAKYRGEIVLVDCFNGGRFIHVDSFQDLSAQAYADVDEYVHRRASARTIISRVLHNLANAYNLAREPENRQLMLELLQMQDYHLDVRDLPR